MFKFKRPGSKEAEEEKEEKEEKGESQPFWAGDLKIILVPTHILLIAVLILIVFIIGQSFVDNAEREIRVAIVDETRTYDWLFDIKLMKLCVAENCVYTYRALKNPLRCITVTISPEGTNTVFVPKLLDKHACAEVSVYGVENKNKPGEQVRMEVATVGVLINAAVDYRALQREMHLEDSKVLNVDEAFSIVERKDATLALVLETVTFVKIWRIVFYIATLLFLLAIPVACLHFGPKITKKADERAKRGGILNM